MRGLVNSCPKVTTMPSYIDYLAEQSHSERIIVSPELDDALAALDAELEQLAPQLEVEYAGPGIGVEGDADVYKMVVRPHEWALGEYS